MYFIRPIIYTLDTAQTDEALIAGEQQLREAWLYWRDNIADLQLDYTQDANWQGTLTASLANSYKNSYKVFRTNVATFNKKYTDALARFNQGDYGIYKKERDGDLYNVIVDFIYET